MVGFLEILLNYVISKKALGTRQIQSIVNKGPNNKSFVAGTMDSKKNTNKYLSTRWYLKSATDV